MLEDVEILLSSVLLLLCDLHNWPFRQKNEKGGMNNITMGVQNRGKGGRIKVYFVTVNQVSMFGRALDCVSFPILGNNFDRTLSDFLSK